MRIATFILLALAAVGTLLPLCAADQASASATVISFAGGSAWNADYSGGTCVWYLPVVGNLSADSLFSDPKNPSKETAYLVWVSEFTVQMLPAVAPFQPAPASASQAPPYTLVLAPAGTGTIYYHSDPSKRVWPKATASAPVTPATLKNMNWGTPVATFTRNVSVVRSADGLTSDTFFFTADLEHSMGFQLPNGQLFDFADMIPHGMTCLEYGQQFSSWESGTCIARGR
ncbi:MAG TPA: hypothetical protein VMS37_10630 [Verrucomicrobiae bacterium]|nr:hypothetical protein [Verrucomicrobiae bacterium]